MFVTLSEFCRDRLPVSKIPPIMVRVLVNVEHDAIFIGVHPVRTAINDDVLVELADEEAISFLFTKRPHL